MWNWIEPISCDLFEGYWNIVDEGKLLNTDEAMYAKWCNEKYNLECEGMKHKESGREHGIVRWVSPTGIICEASYKDGKQHGLCRWIKKSSVYVSLCKDDEVLAKFAFNLEFTELFRDDDKGLLSDLTAVDFIPD